MSTICLKSIGHLVGNTPLLAIRYRYREREGVVYAKAEHLNLTGSIKDRMALHILRQAYERGTIRPGDRIAEATSGNTGISFSAIGRALGHSVVIFMPNWMSRERVELIQSLGASVVPVTHEQGGFVGSIRLAEEFAKAEKDVFLPRQFSNVANVEAHERTTGPEIAMQLESIGVRPDAFVAGVGTGGTVMGVGRCLRAKWPGIKLHPMEPAESPTLTVGCKVGKHRIQGISDEFIPDILALRDLDAVVQVRDGDAVIMAQKLASRLGLGVGISSGANFLAAVQVAEAMGGSVAVTTVFADDNKKYLSTDLMREEARKKDYLSPEVELMEYDTVGRMCGVCETLRK